MPADPRAFTRRYVDDVYVRDLALEHPPAGIALWVHGLGDSGLALEAAAASRALVRFRHVVPDLPGYGRSLWPRPPLDLARQAGRLARLVKTLDLGAVVLVGHGMGGAIGLDFCERYPEFVRAFFDVDGCVSAGDCASGDRLVELTRHEGPEAAHRRLLDEVWARGQEDRALRCYHASLVLADPAALAANAAEIVRRSAAGGEVARLAALSVPVRCVRGRSGGRNGGPYEDNDAGDEARHAGGERSWRRLSAAGVAVVAIEDGGQRPFRDRPDGFARALAGWIGEL